MTSPDHAPHSPAHPPAHAHPHAPDELEDHDLGLAHDLPTILERHRRGALGRRGLLGLLGGVGLVAVAGCGSDASTTTLDAPPVPGAAASDVHVAAGEIPEETAGPYPGDGSNGPDVLSETGIVRSDLTSSFGDASGVAAGVPVTIDLRVLDLTGEEASALSGAAIYLWHCDREGNYSLYSEGVVEENYLRGVQEADSAGRLRFTSVFPGCYAGRWPHMHFEVYASLADATTYTAKLRTSQLALPQDVCEEVYGTAEGYDASVANLAQISLDSDNVFADGVSLQMAKVTGSVADGYTVSLNVPV